MDYYTFYMTDNNELKQQIVDLVLADNYQPLKPRQIAKKLKQLGEEREVRRAIKQLVRAKKIAFASNHLVVKPTVKKKKKPGLAEVQHADSPQEDTPKHKSEAKPKSSSKQKAARSEESAESQSKLRSKKKKTDEVIGTFRKASGGFGFVTPEDSTATDRSEDIFIPKPRRSTRLIWTPCWSAFLAADPIKDVTEARRSSTTVCLDELLRSFNARHINSSGATTSAVKMVL